MTQLAINTRLRDVVLGMLANTFLFIASDQAEFITGSHIVVDGGHLAANIGYR